MSRAPMRRMASSSRISSSVSPLYDSARRRRRSGRRRDRRAALRRRWRKIAGVPVLDSVAASLCAMMPDLPMPVTMTRPVQPCSRSSARSKSPSSCGISPRIALRLGFEDACGRDRSRRWPAWRSVRHDGVLRQRSCERFDDRVDLDEPVEQRREPIERQGVLRVALAPSPGPRGLRGTRRRRRRPRRRAPAARCTRPARRSRRRRRRAAAGCG